MKKLLNVICLLAVFMVILTACGGNNTTSESSTVATESAVSSEQATTTNEEPSEQTITYLGETYTIPANVERIVITGSMEAHEDALVLDVHPVGAVTYAGRFPERYAAITDQAESIGEKMEPNFETILKLKPDVILGTTKAADEIFEQLNKIAPCSIKVFHQSN